MSKFFFVIKTRSLMLEGTAETKESIKSLASHIINGSSLEDTTITIKKNDDSFHFTGYADSNGYNQNSSGGRLI